MKLRLKEHATALKTRLVDLMDDNPFAAAGVLAGVGAVIGLVVGVAVG